MLIACSSPKATSPIDAVLASAVESGRIPGVIAVAATSDEVFYEGMAGTRDLDSGTGMTADTIFQIASMTKAITSVAVMQLVEQGKVELDRAIGFYVPRFADRQVLVGFDEKDEPILRPAESSPTVRQLLTHTSGYAYEIWNADAARYAASGNVSSILTGGDGFLDAPLMSDPGTKWEYGISTDILGVMVEEISGQSLEDYFREHILKPLGMTDTYYVVPDEKLPRLATAYSKSEQGELTPIPYSRSSGDFFSGGGRLKSTAGDYIRFMQAILNDGELDGVRILSAASVDLIAQNHIGDLEAADSVVTSIPYLSNDFNFMPDSADKFGLGFLINTDPIPGGRSAGSLAWAGLYNSYYWIDRNKNICGVLITQILPFYDADVLALLNEFETAVYAAAESAGN
ncbi:MAG: serine hydrolase [Gammaproteobacteria bacterium]